VKNISPCPISSPVLHPLSGQNLRGKIHHYSIWMKIGIGMLADFEVPNNDLMDFEPRTPLLEPLSGHKGYHTLPLIDLGHFYG
jgi:hypothetical protein